MEMVREKKNRLILVILILWVVSCTNSKKEITQIIDKTRTLVEVGDSIEIIYSDSGKVQSKLNAPIMKRIVANEPEIEMPKGVLVIFYDEFLKENSRVTANYAILYQKDRLVRLANDVKITNINNETLSTEELFWDEANNKVYSDKFVRVEKPGETILADGFESNTTLTEYSFKKIKAVISNSKL